MITKTATMLKEAIGPNDFEQYDRDDLLRRIAITEKDKRRSHLSGAIGAALGAGFGSVMDKHPLHSMLWAFTGSGVGGALSHIKRESEIQKMLDDRRALR